MGTRSAIARQNGNSIEAIYCHWDGYISGVGKVLSSYYDEAEEVQALIALGDLSSLGGKLSGTKEHSFGKPEDNVCVAYGRDRGETGTSAKLFKTVQEFVSEMSHSGCEYFYYFDGDNWFVCDGEVDEKGFPVFGFLDVAIAIDEDTKIYG